jgi:hypothetical protein
VVETTSTLATPPLCAGPLPPARRSVSLLLAALVACGVPLRSRARRSKEEERQAGCSAGSSSSDAAGAGGAAAGAVAGEEVQPLLASWLWGWKSQLGALLHSAWLHCIAIM